MSANFSRASAVTALLVFIFPSPSHAVSVLTNGSFEDPGGAPIRTIISSPGFVTGWTHSGTGVEVYESSGQDGISAQNGTYYVSWGHQDPVPSTGGVLSQDFVISPNTTYNVSFWLSTQQACPTCGSQPQSVNVSIIDLANNAALFSQDFSISAQLWTQFLFDFSSPSSTARIVFTDITTGGFGGNSNGINWALDNVEISQTPLPAALPLVTSGLAALGLLGWRRKRKAAALAA